MESASEPQPPPTLLSKLQQFILNASLEKKQEIQEVGKSAFNEVLKLEEIAEKHQRENLHLTKEEVEKIKAILVFSGPGTRLEPFKDDRYKDFEWAKWMDKKRSDYGARIARKIAETRFGEKIKPARAEELKEKARSVISGYAPVLIYNGRPDENETVRHVLSTEDAFSKKVFVIDAPIDKSIDQIKTFRLPDGLNLQAGDRIAIVSHAPHLMRVMHMIEKFRDEMPIPPGVEFQLFPLPTPKNGKAEYRALEVRGLLYYAFISGEASAKSYPYLI